MRILITGAAGNLGTGLIEALAGAHELVLSDVSPVDTPHEFRRADLRKLEDVLPLASGCDAIIHTPAWHGMHSPVKSEVDFWQLNVDGSFHLFQSALRHAVRRVVWVSSVSVTGWQHDKYGFTKFLGEHLCGYYHRVHNMCVVIIRPWDFTPYGDDFLRYGTRLLAGGVDRRDVVGATVRALTYVSEEPAECEAFEIGCDNGFESGDLEAYQRDPLALLERKWPGCGVLIKRHQIALPEKIIRCDLKATREILGYQPRFHFGTFLEALSGP